ncbi:hypothetical protein TNCV_3431421 [Trichonephila clavipes]|nr:hypothetical protein TNCV_3431421 [Trichonephila clavipes]
MKDLENGSSNTSLLLQPSFFLLEPSSASVSILKMAEAGHLFTLEKRLDTQSHTKEKLPLDLMMLMGISFDTCDVSS